MRRRDRHQQETGNLSEIIHREFERRDPARRRGAMGAGVRARIA
jgi:hypothetical protein